jgi:predicted  nucleic acid-binding Zn-ribbon protein
LADPFPITLDRLFKLQELQVEILTKNELKSRTPEHLIHVEAAFQDFLKDVNEKQEKVSRSEGRHKAVSDEIAALQQRLSKYQGQMAAGMKGGNALYAVVDEMEEIKKTVREKEEEILTIEETLNADRGELDALKEKQPEESRDYEAQMTGWRQEQNAMAEQIQRAKVQADQIRKSIDKRLLAMFDKIAKNRGGVGIAKVVMVRNQTAACSACNVLLRPQLLADLRLARETISCESCRRILYWDKREIT